MKRDRKFFGLFNDPTTTIFPYFTSTPNTRDFTINQDGTVETNDSFIPTTCTVGVQTPWEVYFCLAVMLEPNYFLSAASCVSSVRPGLFSLDCNTHQPFYYTTTRKITDTIYYEEFVDLNLSSLKKRNIAIVRVEPPFDSYYTIIRQAVMGNNSKEKREKDLSQFYTECQIYTHDANLARSKPQSKVVFILTAQLLSRYECLNRNIKVMDDEFCMLINRRRNGPCEIGLGAPIVCGDKGFLEGILINDIGKCNETGRLLIGVRVDNYRYLIEKFLANGERYPETPKPGHVPITTERMLLLGVIAIDLWLLFYALIVAVILIILFLITFLVYKCRCEAVEQLPRFIPLKQTAFTLSVNVILPLFVVLSRVVQYCRLRESVEIGFLRKQQMAQEFVDKERKRFKSDGKLKQTF